MSTNHHIEHKLVRYSTWTQPQQLHCRVNGDTASYLTGLHQACMLRSLAQLTANCHGGWLQCQERDLRNMSQLLIGHECKYRMTDCDRVSRNKNNVNFRNVLGSEICIKDYKSKPLFRLFILFTSSCSWANTTK